jgi:uncharacterized protein (AIM24 family)
LNHQILYQPSFSLAVVSLERGEQVMADSGAMVSMSPTIKMEARMSGGGALGARKSAVGGESMFRTTYTAETGPGEVTFARSALGDIMATVLKASKLFVQPGSYLAGDPRLTIGVQGSMRAMLSGEGSVCRYRGPGRISIQTRQLPGFARQLMPFLPRSSSR